MTRTALMRFAVGVSLAAALFVGGILGHTWP